MPTSPIATHAKRLQDISRPRRKAQEQAEFDAEQARIYQELQIYGRVLSPTERVFQPYTDPVKGGEEEGAFRAMKDTLTAGFAGGGLSAVRPGGLAKLFDPRVPASELHALYGIKKYPPLYHGTPTPEAAQAIRIEGFTKGKSAELEIPGASLSSDPSISAKFAQIMTPEQAQDRMLRVIPDLPPSEVRNLRPSEYLSGVKGDKIYNKPNALLFKEAETFLPRNVSQPGKSELQARMTLLTRKDDEIVNLQDQIHGKQHSMLMESDAYKTGGTSASKLRESDEWSKLTQKYDALEFQRDTIRKELNASRIELDKLADKTIPVKVRDLSEDEAKRAFEAKSAVDAPSLGPSSTKEDVAQAIIKTRGNRGAHDRVMADVIDTPPAETLKRFGVDTRFARRLSENFSELKRLAAMTRVLDKHDTLEAAGLHHWDIEDFWKTKKAFYGVVHNAPLNQTVGDLRTTLDDMSRAYVKERNAIANQFIQGSRIKAAGRGAFDPPDKPIAALENRVRAIVERTASRNRTGASADPVATARAKLTIDDVDALNDAGAGITVENVKDVTNQDILDLIEAYKGG